MNEQMREILDIINEMSEEAIVEQYDEFDIELSEDIIIESGIIDINEEGILIEADDKAIELLEQHGLILEETDWSKYDEPTISRIKKGKTKPVDTTDYNTPTYIRKQEGPKPKTGYDKRRADLKKLKADEGVMPFDKVYPQKAEPEIRTKDGRDAKAAEAQLKLARKFGGWNNVPAEEKARLRAAGLLEGDMDEAKYQGREVPLGKPMAGDVKKKKVYVKKPNGKVVKVNFGDKKMRIKKSNPKRRKSFRARHNCKNPGPRWKARYWSCRAW